MITIKGSIGVGYAGCNKEFEYTLKDLGISDEEWGGMSSAEKSATLDTTLDDEIGNVLDASIWVEGE